ncbi:glycoside hydrolase family 36 protein [Vallitalea pronyensis]|nr:glycoside hydrolase family 36 protein [Vallitalea pronyensis]
MNNLIQSSSSIVAMDGSVQEQLVLTRHWTGSTCTFTLINESQHDVQLKEVVLFEGNHGLREDTWQYGEGYQMLSQYEGAMGCMDDISYSDKDHYKLPALEGYQTMYNMTWLFSEDKYSVLGFSSCHRFNGALHFNKKQYKITLDLEGLTLEKQRRFVLEEFVCLEGHDRELLLQQFGECINRNHSPLGINQPTKLPTGWCSWYCYGPQINESIIQDNLDGILEHQLHLAYIQVDDGYQPKMGDWLEPNPAFGMDIKALCRRIREKGFEPGIWVAPFIAEETSKVFTEHPDWFIKDKHQQPLRSDKISFGGWRRGPWYMLDGTHPEARDYLRHVFRTMREDWGCYYFKLDANMWGAMPGGYYYDAKATRTEAYRLGMQACIEGAGEKSFILGCNAPMWPSLGVVHGMRVTSDITRDWDTISRLSRECFHRNWQHKTLWVNDPDCLVLENRQVHVVDAAGKVHKTLTELSKDELSYHRAYILASGGMVLNSDRIGDMHADSIRWLKKLLPPMGQAARFDDIGFTIGKIKRNHDTLVFLFNATNDMIEKSITCPKASCVLDFWREEVMCTKQRELAVKLPPHSARVLQIKTI